MTKLKNLFLSVLSCIVLTMACTGCSNNCPKSLEDDAAKMDTMPTKSKPDLEKVAKFCNEIATKYKDNDRCKHSKTEQEFLLEDTKQICATLELKAR